MKKRMASLLIGSLFLFTGCAGQNGQTDSELLTKAYQFAYPLLIMEETRAEMTATEVATSSKAPINQFLHADHLLNAKDHGVVTPNADTIYSQAFLDLSETPMVFSKPAADRFLSVEILDAYTNSAAILGTGGDTQDKMDYLITGPNYDGTLPEGLTQVKIPTNDAWLLVRTLINNEEDMAEVARLQGQMQLLPLAVYLNNETYTPEPGVAKEYTVTVPERVFAMDMETFFKRANELMAENPPANADQDLLKKLEKYGIGPGLTFEADKTGIDSAEAWKELVTTAMTEAEAEAETYTINLGDWAYPGEPIAEFGTAYGYRAAVAFGGLGANPVSVAIYPKAYEDHQDQTLSGENNYRIHFEKDQLPPVEENGFWSITAYGDDNYLIDNALNRYLINDRSELKTNADGSLDILVQAEAPTDASMTGNWLPSGDSGFHLYMRIYLPHNSIMEGSWKAPSIEKIN